MRPETMLLVELSAAAEKRLFALVCELDRKRRNPPPARVAEHDRLWDEYHEAVLRLRAHFDADRRRALAEQLEYAASYVLAEQEAKLELAAARGRGKQTLDAIRARYADARVHRLDFADEIAHGLGWPHRGEKVIVKTGYYARPEKPGGPSTRKLYEGEAVYETSYSTENTSHMVDAPGVATGLIVSWEPTLNGNWGPADPAGDIPLRLASAPRRKLPPPIPRFPESEWLPAMQLPLLDVA